MVYDLFFLTNGVWKSREHGRERCNFDQVYDVMTLSGIYIAEVCSQRENGYQLISEIVTHRKAPREDNWIIAKRLDSIYVRRYF